MRKVEVLPYQPSWTELYEVETGKLREVFGPQLIDIHHIGSTSVPDLAAKPIIDIMPVVRDIGSIDAFNQNLQALGYTPKGENGISGRRYFERGGDQRTHHVHAYQIGSPHVERHLAFRDYLRTHPQRARTYGDLKLELASTFPWDIDAYIEGKSGLVAALEREAMAWHQNAQA